jgi:hypothetical protein
VHPVGRQRSGHGQRLASGNRERDVHSFAVDHAPWDSRSPSRFGSQTVPGLKKIQGRHSRNAFPGSRADPRSFPIRATGSVPGSTGHGKHGHGSDLQPRAQKHPTYQRNPDHE